MSFSTHNLPTDQISNVIFDCMSCAGSYIEDHECDKSSITKKELNDIVTTADIEIESRVIDIIRSAYPDHSIRSEERAELVDSERYRWEIDPIDGTVNYSKGLPIFSTSISLLDNGRPIQGAVYDHSTKDLYFAKKGGGAYKNGASLHVSDTPDIDNSLITVMLTSHYDREETRETCDAINAINCAVRGVRIMVSSQIELAWLAEGRLDAFVCHKSSSSGASAGELLATEAGGVLTNFSGDPLSSESRHTVCSNGNIHSQLIALLKK